MSILKKRRQNTVNKRLEYGIHDNLYVAAVSVGFDVEKVKERRAAGEMFPSLTDYWVKKDKDNQLDINNDFWLTYNQINPETNDLVASADLSEYKLEGNDPRVVNSFCGRIDKARELLEVLGVSPEAVDAMEVATFVETGIDVDSEDFATELDKLIDSEVLDKAKTNFSIAFMDLIKPFIGDRTKLFRGKIVCSAKGWAQWPKFVPAVEPMVIAKDQTTLSFSNYELTNKAKADAHAAAQVASSTVPQVGKPDAPAGTPQLGGTPAAGAPVGGPVRL